MTQPTLFDAPATVYAIHAREEQAEARRRDSAADRILDALRTGPKTNLELIHLCQRISGRIFDLRRRGYQITTVPLEPGIYRYTLMGGSS